MRKDKKVGVSGMTIRAAYRVIDKTIGRIRARSESKKVDTHIREGVFHA